MTKYFYVENASRPYLAAGLRIEFQVYTIFAGTSRGIFQARNDAELRSLEELVANAKNGVMEIAEADYLAKLAGRPVSQVAATIQEVLVAPKPIGAKCIVQLGRDGEIINILPIAKDLYETTGHKPVVMVAREFAPVLDGVTYAYAEIYPGGDHETLKAKQLAARLHGAEGVIVTQVYGAGHSVPVLTESWSKEAWRLAGYLDKWGHLPLVFDARKQEREAVLAKGAFGDPDGRKVLLLNLQAPGPFPYPKARDLTREVYRLWNDIFNIVDMATVKAERIYDMLGVFDRADLLLTVDSWPLHLASASDIPVIALTQDRPNPWYGTVPRCNCVYQQGYSATTLDGIQQAIEERK